MNLGHTFELSAFALGCRLAVRMLAGLVISWGCPAYRAYLVAVNSRRVVACRKTVQMSSQRSATNSAPRRIPMPVSLASSKAEDNSTYYSWGGGSWGATIRMLRCSKFGKQMNTSVIGGRTGKCPTSSHRRSCRSRSSKTLSSTV